VELQTSQGGYFRSPPVRLGRYAVALPGGHLSTNLIYLPPEKRVRRKGSARSKKAVTKEASAREVTMLVLDITDCSDTSVTVDFQRRENVSGTFMKD
jgi:hypothetical protein